MERNVPKLRFKGFNDEWRETTFKNIFNNFEYGMNSAAIEFDGKNKYIRITDIDESSNKYSKDNMVSPDGILEDKFLVKENDILFARTGASVGKTYLYNIEDGKLYFAGFLIRGNVKKEHDSRFIFMETQTENYRKWVNIISMRSGQPGINSQEYSSYNLKVPSLEEQERIANFLTKVDKIIEKQDEKVKSLEKYKKGMMQKIFSQEIRFKDENGEEYPEWEEKKLGEIADVIMGQSPSSEAYNENYDGVPLIQGNADIKLRKTAPRIYTTEITKTCEIGDIIMSVRAPVGSIGIANHHCCIGRGVCAIKANINNNYLYQVLLEKENKWSSISQGSTFESINRNDINGLKLLLPSLKEQAKIAKYLINLDLIIEKEYAKLEKLKFWKKGLLQKMFI